ncbi:LysR family transcriptional regulator [Pseudomonas syringae group genomosp. 3]|nr:LysR family transcriptional regulator [Pseudomonas syringae group genomosp. 3]
MDRWTEASLLVEIAEQGTMRKAAEALNISAASATRSLRNLEARLGAQLVKRNTRETQLTSTGEELYRRCKLLLAEWREAEAAAGAAALDPSGLLRVSASQSFCILHLAPLAPTFTRLFPRLRLEIISSNRYENVIDSGVDIAVRTRAYEIDSDITIRRLAETSRILAASPSYIAARGKPCLPQDLAQHDLLLYEHAENPSKLLLTRDGQRTTIPVQGLLLSNDGQVLRHAALAGLGVVIQPKYVLLDDIAAGYLVPVLEDWELPRLTINLAFQTRLHLPAKVRVFIDFLANHFHVMDYERKWTE